MKKIWGGFAINFLYLFMFSTTVAQANNISNNFTINIPKEKISQSLKEFFEEENLIQFHNSISKLDNNNQQIVYDLFSTQKFNFSILFPNESIISYQPKSHIFNVDFLWNEVVSLSVSLEEANAKHLTVFSTISKYQIDDWDEDLSKRIYSNNEFVYYPQVRRIFIANNNALESRYFYQVNNFGKQYYIFVCKVEMIKNKIFYKIECSSLLFDSLEEALKGSEILIPIYYKSIESFTFLN